MYVFFSYFKLWHGSMNSTYCMYTYCMYIYCMYTYSRAMRTCILACNAYMHTRVQCVHAYSRAMRTCILTCNARTRVQCVHAYSRAMRMHAYMHTCVQCTRVHMHTRVHAYTPACSAARMHACACSTYIHTRVQYVHACTRAVGTCILACNPHMQCIHACSHCYLFISLYFPLA